MRDHASHTHFVRGTRKMDYELGTETEFDVDAIIGDFEVDYDDDALTLPEDELFDN